LFCFFLFASRFSGLGFGVHGFGLAEQDVSALVVHGPLVSCKFVLLLVLGCALRAVF